MGIMSDLYNETSDRLYLLNRYIGKIKGVVKYPFLRSETQVIDEVKKLCEECDAEYQRLWDKQIGRLAKPDVSDQSTCCGMPIEAQRDDDGEILQVCSKCGDECSTINPEPVSDYK